MKIDGGKGNNRISGANAKKANAKGGSNSASKSSGLLGESSGGDRIEVSAQTETLDIIRQMVSDVPDVRMEEVERVMKKLKDGKYQVDYEKVADGFIKEALLNEFAKRMGKRRDA